MIRLLFYEYFYSKKRFLYLLAIILIFCLIIYLTYDKSADYEQLLYKEELNIYIDNIGLKVLNISFLLLGSLFLIDHNLSAEIIIIPYKSRSSVFINKLLFFIILFLFLTFLVYSFWHLYLLNFTKYYYYKSNLNKYFISFYLDLLILTIISFFLIKNNKQNRIIFIILLSTIHNLILEDNFHNYLFYLYPINMYNEISNILLYKLLYLCFITNLYYLYYIQKNIY